MCQRRLVHLTEDTLAEYSTADLERAEDIFSESRLPEDPLTALMGKADLSYHLIKRSCVTQSLVTVQMGLDRVHRKLDLGPAPRLKILPDELPPWTGKLAQAGRAELLTLLPGALLFVAQNSYILPSHAHTILEAHGLIALDGQGRPIRYYYHRSTATPWGPICDNMM